MSLLKDGKKRCGRGHVAPIEEFGKDATRADGYTRDCRACRKKFRGARLHGEYAVEYGPPLQRAYYEPRVVDGRTVIVREIR